MRTVGDLRERVFVERRRVVKDAGQQSDQWETLYSCRAEILHASAREFAQAAGTYAESTAIIHLREPVALGIRLDSGLRVRSARDAWSVVEVVYGKPKAGFVELRARRVEMEGYGA